MNSGHSSALNTSPQAVISAQCGTGGVGSISENNKRKNIIIMNSNIIIKSTTWHADQPDTHFKGKVIPGKKKGELKTADERIDGLTNWEPARSILSSEYGPIEYSDWCHRELARIKKGRETSYMVCEDERRNVCIGKWTSTELQLATA